MSPSFDDLCELAAEVGRALSAHGWRLATAESCTGGLVSAAITSVAGSSDWFDRGFVTYSNAAKTALLDVPAESIARFGAVSADVARAMAQGAAQRSGVNLAVAITGIAGPGGGSAAKPVGTVWFGLAWRDMNGLQTASRHALLSGDRGAVRMQAAQLALRWVRDAAQIAAPP